MASYELVVRAENGARHARIIQLALGGPPPVIISAERLTSFLIALAIDSEREGVHGALRRHFERLSAERDAKLASGIAAGAAG
jgi:hypothetical protein